MVMNRSKGSKKISVKQLLVKAEALVDECQPELALKFYQKASALQPENSEILDAIGELATEVDEPEIALEAFKKSMQIAPKQNPGKWLYAAQLVQGEESETFSLQGVAVMTELLQTLDPNVRAFYMLSVLLDI